MSAAPSTVHEQAPGPVTDPSPGTSRAIGRRIRAALCVLSLLLAGAVCALWARSRWIRYELHWAGLGEVVELSFDRSRLTIIHYDCRTAPDPARNWRYRHFTGKPRQWRQRMDNSRAGQHRVLGFGFGSGSDPYPFIEPPYLGEPFLGVEIPAWFLVLLLVVPTTASARALVRSRQRRARGLCAWCGYDLRASAERCPECGRFATRREES